MCVCVCVCSNAGISYTLFYSNRKVCQPISMENVFKFINALLLFLGFV